MSEFARLQHSSLDARLPVRLRASVLSGHLKPGDFDLANLPPGTYTIETWHERFGTLDQTVTIGPKESKTITFTFDAKSH